MGVPIIGCRCEVCRSSNSRNRRLRPSILIQYAGKNILIDISPDFRQQALENNLSRLDALILTHAHADHCLGMDDLRVVVDRHGSQLPLYASAATLNRLHKIFGYFFSAPMWNSDVPRLKTIEICETFNLFGQEFTPVEVLHDRDVVLGFRFGSTAYITDVSYIPKSSSELLAGLDLLVISALRYKPHPKHFSLEQALEFIAGVQPKRALLTHMSHEFDYDKLSDELPEGVSPAYDGQVVEL